MKKVIVSLTSVVEEFKPTSDELDFFTNYILKHIQDQIESLKEKVEEGLHIELIIPDGFLELMNNKLNQLDKYLVLLLRSQNSQKLSKHKVTIEAFPQYVEDNEEDEEDNNFIFNYNLDEILDQINAQGIDSLNTEQRKVLESFG